MQGYSIPETTRAYGAVLLNAEGEEFTDSLGPRDEVAQAIIEEVDQARSRDARRPAGGPLDTTRIPEADADDLPSVHAPRYRGTGSTRSPNRS